MKKLILAAALVVSPLVANAGDCFNQWNLRNLEIFGTDSVTVETSEGSYTVNTVMCPDLRVGASIYFDTKPAGNPEVCAMDDIVIIDEFTNAVVATCPIISITKN